MSVVLFFGFAFLVLLSGFSLVGFSLYHNWKKSKEASKETFNESALLK